MLIYYIITLGCITLFSGTTLAVMIFLWKRTKAMQISANAALETYNLQLQHLQAVLLRQMLNDNKQVEMQLKMMSDMQNQSLQFFATQLTELQKSSEIKLENIRKALEDNLYRMHKSNDDKLEKMRATVEEKLQDTLEKRLGESFKMVSERLEMVHKGIGEMQSLASGVGDLKKVLTNIKSRGTWGEVQLEALIDQMLAPEQFAKNVCVQPANANRVEFAIKLPGKNNEKHIWLPIDAKFPLEDYQRLMEYQEHGLLEKIEAQQKVLENTIKLSAKTIMEKYIHPPDTTDFAIMFIPIEGLYAEISRKPGLLELLQREYRIIITSPTTLMAILSSLQMGFQTLAIEKRSSEVWKLLSIVKSEFLKFAQILSKTKSKLDQASKVIEEAECKTRNIQRKLTKVQLPDVITDTSKESIESIVMVASE